MLIHNGKEVKVSNRKEVRYKDGSPTQLLVESREVHDPSGGPAPKGWFSIEARLRMK